MTLSENLQDVEDNLRYKQFAINRTAFASKGVGQYISNGTIVTSANNEVLFIKVKKGDVVGLTCTHTAAKTVAFGLFADVPELGDTAIEGTYHVENGKNIVDEYRIPQDGYYAIATYYKSGTFTYYIKEYADANYYDVDFSVLGQVKGWLAATGGKYSITDYGSHYAIPTNGSSRAHVVPQTGKSVYVYFVKSYHAPASATDIDLCSTCADRIEIPSEKILFIPNDCTHIVVGGWANQTLNCTPQTFGLNDFDGEVVNKIAELDNTIGYIYFAQGSYGISGVRSYNTSYVRSCLFKGERTISVNPGYNIRYLFKWTSENNFVSYSTINQMSAVIPDDGYYYSIVVNKTDNSAISPDEDIVNYLGAQQTVFDSIIGQNLDRLKGATLNIIGDSVSNPDRTGYSLSTVWWGVMCNALGISVGNYNCISGTAVGGSASNSFHNRIGSLDLDGNIAVIAGGMNDLGFANTPLGTFDYTTSLDEQLSDNPSLTDNFIPAYRKVIEYILKNNKNTRLYLCTITPRAIKKTTMTDDELFFPWTNPTTQNNWAEFNEAIRKLAHDYGVGLIDFANIGMYQQNGFADESEVLPADNIWTDDGVHPKVAYQKKMGDLATRILAETMV